MIKRIVLSPHINLIVRLALGALFIYAGAVKLMDVRAFARSVDQYGLVPESLLPVVAIGLPALEVIAGIGLAFNMAGSLTAICGMLVMFIVVLWYGILHDLDIDCGCFSQDELRGHASLWAAFYRDLVMMAAVVYLYVWRIAHHINAPVLPLRSRIKKIL